MSNTERPGEQGEHGEPTLGPDQTPDSPADSPDTPAGPATHVPEGILPPASHADDGLDFAKAAARAASKVPGQPATRRRSPGAASAKRRRRGRAGHSGAWPDDRDPQTLSSSLDRLVSAGGWDLDLRVQGVFGRWQELVGEEIADHCTPENLTDGRLQVRTTSTAWATQLRLLAPTLVRRLNEELGHGTVTVIDVLGPHLPSWKKGPRSTKGRGPRDTYG